MATGRDGIPGVPVAGGVVEEFKLALGPAPILHHPSEALTVKASLWNEGRATRTNALVSKKSVHIIKLSIPSSKPAFLAC